jgi:general stress protein YciG
MTEKKEKPKAKRGFAAMSKEQLQKISSMGGSASSSNFKNDPERASKLGKIGGHKSRRTA